MMEEVMAPFNFPIEDKSERIIKVIGVGGGGGNAVQHMWKGNVKNVSFLVTNTDSQVLKANMVPNRVQLGDGLGTGGNPELGREIAEKSIEDIKAMFDVDTKMVFITAGMGGGTGTGAAPVIARVAREMGILTVGVVTLPFKMEGKERIDKALDGMETLKKCVDSLIVINNQKLLENERFYDLSLEEGMKKADEVLTVATKTIAEIITVRGMINRDYNDVSTVMKDGGAALVSIAKASGERRIFKAMSDAISSPLVANVEKQKVQRMLYIVYSGSKSPAMIRELEEVGDFLEKFDDDIKVLWGHYPDESLGDEIKVAVIATGFDRDGEKAQGEVMQADEKNRRKDLRDKYYGNAHAEAKEQPAEEDAASGTEDAASGTEDAQSIETEPADADLEDAAPDKDEGESVVDAEAPSDVPSFMERLLSKLNHLIEE